MQFERVIHREIAWNDLEVIHQDLVAHVARNSETGFLLVSEPLPTFTQGRATKQDGLVWSAERINAERATLGVASRGGQWTFHGPGQVVLYPILPLQKLGYHRHAIYHFMQDLRSFVKQALLAIPVLSQEQEHPFGLYVEGRKLVSFGVAIQKGVSSNGLALYQRSQAHYFSGIHPCGVQNGRVTSLEELGQPLSWNDVAQSLCSHIELGFKSKKRC